jgi:hypothetical protein
MGVCGFLISEKIDVNLKDDEVVMTEATHPSGNLFFCHTS